VQPHLASPAPPEVKPGVPAAVSTMPQTVAEPQPPAEAKPAEAGPVKPAAPQEKKPVAGYGPMTPLAPGSTRPIAPGEKKSTAEEQAEQSAFLAGRPDAGSAEVVSPPEPIAEVPADVSNPVSLLRTREPLMQIRGAVALRALGPKAATAAADLIATLRYTNPYVPTRKERRLLNADSLIGISPARAAMLALVDIGPSAVGPLGEALTNRYASVKSGAAWALGELKGPRSADPLVAALRDSSQEVRSTIVEALGKIRDPKTIPVLLGVMNDDPKETVKLRAGEALKNLSEIPNLIDGLRDRSPTVRQNAAYILFLMTAREYKDTVELWEQWWKQEQDPQKKQATPRED